LARVVTVFAGQPPGELNSFARFQHDRWGADADAVEQRRAEDDEAMRALGATPMWLNFPDAIYRGKLYLSDDDLFGPVKAGDSDTALAIHASLAAIYDALRPAVVYAPVGIGGHVDHRLIRDAVLACHLTGCELLLYEDFPYAAADGAVQRWTTELPVKVTASLADVTDAMAAKIRSIAAYATQLPTIFRHYGEWESVTRDYANRIAGRDGAYAERLWRVERSNP
jgi:LmbE family N-acetylglucosaminyl deacetylase